MAVSLGYIERGEDKKIRYRWLAGWYGGGGGLLETGFDNAYRGPSIGKEGEE